MPDILSFCAERLPAHFIVGLFFYIGLAQCGAREQVGGADQHQGEGGNHGPIWSAREKHHKNGAKAHDGDGADFGASGNGAMFFPGTYMGPYLLWFQI